jgi:hypothetical protein
MEWVNVVYEVLNFISYNVVRSIVIQIIQNEVVVAQKFQKWPETGLGRR